MESGSSFVGFLQQVYDFLFSSWLYRGEMSDYLSGTTVSGEIENTSSFPILWLVAILAGALFSILYYKVIDKDSWARGWIWFLWGLLISLVIFPGTAGILWDQLTTEGTYLYTCAYKGSEELIDLLDIFGIATAQLILTYVFYFLFSLLFKRFSYSCRYIPFK